MPSGSNLPDDLEVDSGLPPQPPVKHPDLVEVSPPEKDVIRRSKRGPLSTAAADGNSGLGRLHEKSGPPPSESVGAGTPIDG